MNVHYKLWKSSQLNCINTHSKNYNGIQQNIRTVKLTIVTIQVYKNQPLSNSGLCFKEGVCKNYFIIIIIVDFMNMYCNQDVSSYNFTHSLHSFCITIKELHRSYQITYIKCSMKKIGNMNRLYIFVYYKYVLLERYINKFYVCISTFWHI